MLGGMEEGGGLPGSRNFEKQVLRQRECGGSKARPGRQASIALIRNVNFNLLFVIPKSVSLEHLTHEMPLGQRVPVSHQLGKSHIQVLLPPSPPWRVTRHITILKALRSPAAKTFLTNYSRLPLNHPLAFVLCRKHGSGNREPLQVSVQGSDRMRCQCQGMGWCSWECWRQGDHWVLVTG